MNTLQKKQMLVVLKENKVIIALFCYFILVLAVPHSREVFLNSLYGWVVLTVSALAMMGVIKDIFYIYKGKFKIT